MVNGTNHANISVQSDNNVAVTNNGNATAGTGGSLVASAGGPDLHASAIVNPAAAAAIGPAAAPAPNQSTSTDVSATGLTVSNLSQTQVNSTVTAPTGPVNVTQSSTTSLVTNGQTQATSAGTCAGTGCTPSTNLAVATSNLPSAGQAMSGNANALGLEAQNVVNTSATVSVQVAGSNYGPIQVVVETMTNIINWGTAQAQTGLASVLNAAAPATTGLTAAAGPLLSSTGNAQATGALVNNQVSMSSSVVVQVPGDNYNPIQVMVQFVANLSNGGVATAISGNAQSGPQAVPVTGSTGTALPGATGLSASSLSGSANATGLQVTNQIDLASTVSIDVNGSNYAPIDVYVVLGTQINNQGQAQAISGQSQVGSSTTNGGSTSSAGPSAGSTAGSSATTGASSGTGGASTGSATTQSIAASITGLNQQYAGSSDAARLNSVAANSASYLVKSVGQAGAQTGVTATGPIPAATLASAHGVVFHSGPNGPGVASEPNGPSADGPSAGAPSSMTANPGSTGIAGTVVNLDLWSTLPDPGLTAMPGQNVHLRTVDRSRIQVAPSTLYPLGLVSDPAESSMPALALRPTADAPAHVVAAASAPTTASAATPSAPVQVASTAAVAPAASTGSAPARDENTTRLILAALVLATGATGGLAWRRPRWLNAAVTTALMLVILAGLRRA
jgi:hypothetical protein